MGRFYYLSLGIVLVILGVVIIMKPEFNHYQLGYHLDFTEIRWPFGIFLIVIGGLFIYFLIRRKSRLISEEEKVLMCKECMKPVYKKDTLNELCPLCGKSLEELEGFYDRHPELK